MQALVSKQYIYA